MQQLCGAVRASRAEGAVGEGVEGWEMRARFRIAEEALLLRCLSAALACGYTPTTRVYPGEQNKRAF